MKKKQIALTAKEARTLYGKSDAVDELLRKSFTERELNPPPLKLVKLITERPTDPLPAVDFNESGAFRSAYKDFDYIVTLYFQEYSTGTDKDIKAQFREALDDLYERIQ